MPRNGPPFLHVLRHEVCHERPRVSTWAAHGLPRYFHALEHNGIVPPLCHCGT